eukprot:CAMPEP_0183399600 /NCGR_PEP_ID=MMETSP0370-20130417/12038_1 /TAXON_ID=268820 /ORGANISM="Peridinium aciculiferum, Strain PAER-2" /LENGTH=434 /DNA_ID=CAMNT_0025580771 /DNA_START=74 /DNA_END=1375 /DNA_ORIENTATION=-
MDPLPDPDVLYVSGLVAAIFRSPTWVAPISSFVDDNCGIFEDQDENKLEYTLIHNGFQLLVDELLEAHLVELSVTTEQFTRFCASGMDGDNEFHKELVEQLLSVDDFVFFKAMMVKRNAQLYRQAMEIYSLMAAMAAGEASPQTALMPPEPDYSEHLKAQQKLEDEHAALENEKMELQQRCVEAELQLAMALSMQLKKRLQLMEALSEILEAIAEMQEGSLDALAAEAAAETGLMITPMYAVTDGGAPHSLDEEHEAAVQRERAQRAMEASRQTLAARAAAVPAGPSEEERKARAEHLKRQRDALAAKKKQQHHQELSAHTQTVGPTLAASVAERAMTRQEEHRGRRLAAELAGQVPEPAPVSPVAAGQDDKAAEMRRILTSQLRATFGDRPSTVEPWKDTSPCRGLIPAVAVDRFELPGGLARHAHWAALEGG